MKTIEYTDPRWDQLEVGQSFTIPGETTVSIAAQKYLAKVRTGYKFKARTTDEGVRVERVK